MEGKDILESENNVVKVVPVLKSGGCIGNKRIWESFPELLSIEEEFVILEQTTKIRTGSDIRATQKIIKIVTDGSDKDLWDKLCRVREEVKGTEWLAFQQVPGRTVSNQRKMFECIFRDTTNRRDLFTVKDQQMLKQKPNRRERRDNTKERDMYTLMVEGKNKEAYTEVLRCVKDKVRDTTSSSKIRGLKSTRDGRLLITLEKDREAANKVEEILEEMATNLKVTKPGKKEQEKAIHIRDLDALTTKQDIVEAVERKIGPLTGKPYRLSELRPNAGNTLPRL